jgi:hypothetical protein
MLLTRSGFDDKEQAYLNGDNNTSNVGKVINITLKKGYKKSALEKSMLEEARKTYMN